MSINPLQFGFWNMRGLNDPLKQREVRSFVNKNNLSIIGLVEHKIKEINFCRITCSMFPFWSFVHNYSHSASGRICVGWDSSIVSVDVLGQSSQAIHCLVKSVAGNLQFVATFVYGSNLYNERIDLWRDLNSWNNPGPWVILGDFNALRFPSDKVGGDNHWPPHMDNFGQCINANELDDLKYTGCHFTWSNKQDPSHVVTTKIDRVLVNEQWIKSFVHSNAHFHPPGISDHSPAVVFLHPSIGKFNKPFKFFNFLADHPKFLDVVQQVWRVIVIGNPMYVTCEKLRLLQKELKKLNTREYSDISSRALATKQQLDVVQKDLGGDPTNFTNQIQERALCKQYMILARAEESFAKQKSRIQWLKLGDQCTSYFFKSISHNRNRGSINSLVLSNGNLTHDPELIKSTFVEYYTHLLGTPHSTQYHGGPRTNQLVSAKLSDVQRDAMIIEISNTEIKETFMSLNPNKAPGPDGYNAGFFQKTWAIVGQDVTSTVRNFFSSGKLLTKANSTSVALVPKIPNPSKVGDYRPISCCNTIYKCIAKIISKRIQAVLPHLIDPVQSGFVQGRRITDNIFLTQEIMRDYHKHSSSPRCALKVDIMKAYDNVRWEFLWDFLASMNFHPLMIQWIKACVTTANYSLSINGEPTGSIKGKKGLKQGDPLSFYLFVNVMEIFTQLLREKSSNSNFHFHWRCEKTKIINLCFADDLMI